MEEKMNVLKKVNIRRLVVSAIGAAILNFFIWAGYYITVHGSIFYIGEKSGFRIYTWTCSFLLITAALYFLYGWMEKKKPASGWDNVNAKKAFFILMAVFFAIWLIYLFIFYPASITADTEYQIGQTYGHRPLSDHHPWYATLIVGGLAHLGEMIFGDIYHGLVVVSIVQMIFVSASAAAACTYLLKRRVNKYLCVGVILFFALNPLIGAYSVTIWKDIWHANFIMLFTIVLIDMCLNEERFFSSKKCVILLILAASAVGLSKKSGIYITALALLVMLIVFFRRHKKQVLIVIGSVILAYLLLHTVMINVLDIEKGRLREALSVPMQQIARTVKYASYDLTDEQKEIISELLPIESLPELYDPRLSDPVKSEFDDEKFKEDPGKYISCYLDLFAHNKVLFIDSFIENSYGYWYPDVEYWQMAPGQYLDFVFSRIDKGRDNFDPNAENYTPDTVRDERVNKFVGEYNELKTVPILRGFFTIAFYFWAALIITLYYIYRKQYRMLLPCIVLFGLFLTCVISPVYAEMRYAYGAVITVPVLLAVTLQNMTKRPFCDK